MNNSVFELPSAPASSGVRLRAGNQVIVSSVCAPFRSIRTLDIERIDGVIVIAWRAEPDAEHHADMGDILCSTSHDEGRTWSAPVELAGHDEQWAYANVVLYARGGELHAFIGRCPMSSPHSDQQRLVSRVSRDGGRTWSDGGLEMKYPFPTIGGGKVTRHGDRYLMPFHRNDFGFEESEDRPGFTAGSVGEPSVRLHGVLVSDDLRVWSLGGVVPQDDDVFLQEGFLTPSTDGSGDLLLVMREGDWRVSLDDEGEKTWTLFSVGHCAYVSRSRDGLKWSPALPWREVPNYNVKGAFLTDAGNRQVTFFNDAPDRNRLYVMARGEGGWCEPLLIAGSGGWNCYAMAVEAGSGCGDESRILAAYEVGKRQVAFQEVFVSGR